MSGDGKWILSISVADNQLSLVPAAAGEPRKLTDERYNVWWAALLGDGKRLLLSAVEQGHRPRIYVMGLEGGTPRPITPEGFFFDYLSHGFSPDGRSFSARSGDGSLWMFPVEGGAGRMIPGTKTSDNIAGASLDSKSLFIYDVGETRATLSRLDIATGARQAMRKIGPADAAAVTTVGPIVSSADGKTYVYSYARSLSDLFLVDGVK
jgi:Tol biopolymer transport system component